MSSIRPNFQRPSPLLPPESPEISEIETTPPGHLQLLELLMRHLNGHVEDLIGKGASSRVYQIRLDSGSPRALKVFAEMSARQKIYTLGTPDTSSFASACRSYSPGRGEALLASFSSKEGRPLYYNGLEISETPNDRSRLVAVFMPLHVETLAQWASKNPAPPLSKIADILLDLSTELAEFHDYNIAHRDLKPENTMIGTDGHAHIIDFGLAMRCNNSQTSLERLSSPLRGTVSYQAPERSYLSSSDQKKADIWALGLIIHRILFGYLPLSEPSEFFDGDSLEIDQTSDDRFNEILNGMLTINPQNRLSAREIAQKISIWNSTTFQRG